MSVPPPTPQPPSQAIAAATAPQFYDAEGRPVVIVQAPRGTTNSFAVASLVFSILWLFWIGSLIGFVCASIAIRQIDKSNGGQTGRGLAVAGALISFLSLFGPLTFLMLTGWASA